MGYQTRFSLKWEPTAQYRVGKKCNHANPKGAKFCCECGIELGDGKQSLDEIMAKKIKASEEMSYYLCEDGSGNNSGKWYSCDHDMIAVSLEIPNVLFTLHGEGEESGDIWDAYFLNGKMQKEKARIVIDPFDAKKLKPL
jgi:hypothetical protein